MTVKLAETSLTTFLARMFWTQSFGTNSKCTTPSKFHQTHRMTFFPNRSWCGTDGVAWSDKTPLLFSIVVDQVHPFLVWSHNAFPTTVVKRIVEQSVTNFNTLTLACASVSLCGSCRGFLCTKSSWFKWLGTIFWLTPSSVAKSQVFEEGWMSNSACKSPSSNFRGAPERGLSSRSKSPELKRLNHLPTADLLVMPAFLILEISSAASL